MSQEPPKHQALLHILKEPQATARRLIRPQINYNIVPFGVFPSLGTSSFSPRATQNKSNHSPPNPASQIFETGHHYHLPRWKQSFHNVHINQVITMYILNNLWFYFQLHLSKTDKMKEISHHFLKPSSYSSPGSSTPLPSTILTLSTHVFLPALTNSPYPHGSVNYQKRNSAPCLRSTLSHPPQPHSRAILMLEAESPLNLDTYGVFHQTLFSFVVN